MAEAESRQHIELELAAARRIQQGLLPKKSPNVQGFEIAGWSRPADETGSDYYDWQILYSICKIGLEFIREHK